MIFRQFCAQQEILHFVEKSNPAVCEIITIVTRNQRESFPVEAFFALICVI